MVHGKGRMTNGTAGTGRELASHAAESPIPTLLTKEMTSALLSALTLGETVVHVGRTSTTTENAIGTMGKDVHGIGYTISGRIVVLGCSENYVSSPR